MGPSAAGGSSQPVWQQRPQPERRDSGTRVRAGEGSRTGSLRGDRGLHAPGPTHSGSRGRDRSSISYTAPQDEEYGAWAVGFRTWCDHGALISFQHRGPACPPVPSLLAFHPGAPRGRSLSLSLAAGSPATRPPRVQPPPPIPCASLRGWLQTVWASQRGPGNRATGSQSHACQLPSGRDQGGREGGTSPLANRGGFLGHRVRGHRVGPVGGAVGERQRPERRPRGARGTQSTEAALRGRGLWPAGRGDSRAAG